LSTAFRPCRTRRKQQLMPCWHSSPNHRITRQVRSGSLPFGITTAGWPITSISTQDSCREGTTLSLMPCKMTTCIFLDCYKTILPFSSNGFKTFLHNTYIYSSIIIRTTQLMLYIATVFLFCNVYKTSCSGSCLPSYVRVGQRSECTFQQGRARQPTLSNIPTSE
jgi:hypothetical protein